METPHRTSVDTPHGSRSGVESPQTGRSSVVEGLLREEFLPVVPAEDDTAYEKVVNELVGINMYLRKKSKRVEVLDFLF